MYYAEWPGARCWSGNSSGGPRARKGKLHAQASHEPHRHGKKESLGYRDTSHQTQSVFSETPHILCSSQRFSPRPKKSISPEFCPKLHYLKRSCVPHNLKEQPQFSNSLQTFSHHLKCSHLGLKAYNDKDNNDMVPPSRILQANSNLGTTLKDGQEKMELVLLFVAVQLLNLVQLFCDSMDCSPAGSSVHGISPVTTLERVTISFCRGSFQPREQTCVSCSAGRFFTTEPPGRMELVLLPTK